MPKVNNPGCGCCTPPCAYECPDETLVDLQEVEWDVTLPNAITFYLFKVTGGTRYFWVYETSGWAAFNGTYSVTKRTTPTCGWNYPEEVNPIDVTWYFYPADRLASPPDPNFYYCPSSSYSSTSTNTYNARAYASETGWSALLLDSPGLPALPSTPDELLSVFFFGFGQGPNMNSPCEAASLSWSSEDRFAIDSRCPGITYYTATATLTPTII